MSAPPPGSEPRLVRFGVFELDTRTRELRKRGTKLKLPEQSIQILATLLERRGELVTRDELQKKLWPNDTIVEFDHSINAAIKRLRQALGDTAETPRFIETLPRRGYRFIYPVEGVMEQPEEASAKKSPAIGSPDGEGNPIGETVSRYRILGELGRGGMGVVYKAEDAKLGRMVALKFLTEDLLDNPSALDRLRREARTGSSLNHPNICTVYDVEAHEGHAFVVMELLEGQPLSERIQGAPLQLGELLDLADQIASALDSAHRQGIIHRDIRPANIFVTTSGQAKILDFGIAKRTDFSQGGPSAQSTLTGPGSPVGTVSYMSPEQARGEQLDARTDLFSFGIVLYQMATGQSPFQGGSAGELMGAILHQTPEPPSKRNPQIPLELERIIAKALEKDRDSRFQSAADLRADLKRLKRDTDSSRVSAPAGVSQPPTRRLRLWPSAATGLAIIAIAGAVWVAQNKRGDYSTSPSRETPLIGLPGSANHPSFSPDGKQLAYSWEDEEGEHGAGINVKLVGGGTALRLTNGPQDDYFPAWSPDGQWIAFWRALPNNSGVYVVSALGGPARRIIDLVGCWGIEWLPDGQHLVVSGGPNFLLPEQAGNGAPRATEPSRLWLVAVDTGQQQPLTSPPAGFVGDLHPAVSPDGKTLAFTRSMAADSSTLYLMPIEGGPPRWLTADADSIAWMPDGQEVVFSSGGGRLWRIPVAGGAPRAVTYSAERAYSPAVSRRGDRLVFVVEQERDSLWRVDLTSLIPPSIGQPIRVGNSTGGQWSPPYSPDGSKIVFNSDRSLFDELWVEDAQGRDAVQLTKLESPNSGSPRWSPDSSWIAFDSRSNGNADICRGSARRRKTSAHYREFS